MLIDCCDIAVHRPNAAPLVFPDFSVAAGAHVLLLGPSGSGKTTLLSVLAGLLPPDRGHVLFRGASVDAMSPSAKDRWRGTHIGFVFQTLHLLPSLTVAQNICLGADMVGRKADPDRLCSLLATLGLTDKAQRKPDALSQGEQQRVAIARAVFLQPDIIIADEPTSALDDDNARIVMDLLLEQAKLTRAALLVATHDSRIKEYFDTVIDLDPASSHGGDRL